jgi:TRAP-type C4-dicarboxylate transport system permease small subunit
MSTSVYLISMSAMFGTILAVFGFKYWSAAIAAKAQTANTEGYRKLATDAVTAQTGNAATLAAIQSELAEVKTRLTSVENILKAVG